MPFIQVIRHVFVMSALLIALCAIYMAFSGQLSGPNSYIALRSGEVVAVSTGAEHPTTPVAMARRIIPNDADSGDQP